MDEIKSGPGVTADTDPTNRREEPELYVEPAKMTSRDTVGVVAALFALAIVGVLGYIWLNPNLGISNLGGAGKAVQEPGEAPVFTAGVDSMEVRCPYCNMFAAKSASYIVATMGDGTVQHFDSWDCLFKYGTEEKQPLVSAQVAKYGSDIGDPLWLTAADAVYLYDTKQSIQGSMPPGVAAFESEADAAAETGELGGTVLGFTELMAKWQFADYKPDLPVIPRAAGTSAAAPAIDQGADVLADPSSHDHDMGCPYCGMFADKSGAHSVVLWSDGSHSHFDSWDCVFNYEKDKKLMLDQARVVAYSGSDDPRAWLDATLAFYLYDTKEINGSMPPYVAAFETRDLADAARGDLGGEVVDFAALRKKWSD
jgi:nitrous oxide reductase accessory protein NosL